MFKYLNFKTSLLIILSVFLSGCDWALFDPKGPVADGVLRLTIICVSVMLIVVVPVIIMSVYFPYKFRSTNKETDYKPNWEHSTKIEIVVWTVPILIISVLAYFTYVSSHELDPRRALESDNEKMVIQVVAMDWKWLFIYPEEEIATVNELAIPVNTPVEFLITSDTVMNSFFIPHLGSQIYAMTGMENRMNLMADEIGEYPGLSANYSGAGFSGMKFMTLSKSDEDFASWVESVKNSPQALDDANFKQLQTQSYDNKPEHFNAVSPLLFNNIIKRFTGELYGS